MSILRLLGWWNILTFAKFWNPEILLKFWGFWLIFCMWPMNIPINKCYIAIWGQKWLLPWYGVRKTKTIAFLKVSLGAQRPSLNPTWEGLEILWMGRGGVYFGVTLKYYVSIDKLSIDRFRASMQKSLWKFSKLVEFIDFCRIFCALLKKMSLNRVTSFDWNSIFFHLVFLQTSSFYLYSWI